MLSALGCRAPVAEPATESPAEPPRAADDHGLRDLNGTRLYVKRIGQGEPIIFVHGGPVLDHGYLLRSFEPLAATHELIFFDQRLSGRSDGAVAPESVRLQTFIEDIEAVRADVGQVRVHLIAHSWGGLLALLYAAAHPQRVGSLILLDSMSASSELWQAEEQALAAVADPEDLREAEALRASGDPSEPETILRLLQISFRPQFFEPERADELDFFIPEDYGERSRQFGEIMVDLQSFDHHPELEAIEAPTLLLYGDQEPGATLGGKALLNALADAHLELVPNAGHFPFVEQPDVVLAHVQTFLAQHPL